MRIDVPGASLEALRHENIPDDAHSEAQRV